MMYQCGRCGLTRASGQEIGVIQKCKCPWDFVQPTPPQRTWVGLNSEEIRKAKHHMVEGAYQYSFKQGAEWAEAQLKEKNT